MILLLHIHGNGHNLDKKKGNMAVDLSSNDLGSNASY
jgi:hypothetical protein